MTDAEARVDAAAGADPTSAAAGTGRVEIYLVGTLVAAVVVGAGLAVTARTSALALLVAVAVAQGLLALSWALGTGMPGRKGAIVIAALAGGGADFACSMWPHGRLGTLLAVLGLAIPVLFVHQLMRGAARVQVVSSLSAVALLVLAEVALPALLQLRHEFDNQVVGGHVVAAAVVAAAGAIVAGCLVDLLLPVPRFDPDVPRGLPALVASAVLGGVVGYLMLKTEPGFDGARGVFAGAALGALAGLLAVAGSFVLYTTPEPPSLLGRRLRPVIGALLALALLAPAAYLLCLAVRS